MLDESALMYVCILPSHGWQLQRGTVLHSAMPGKHCSESREGSPCLNEEWGRACSLCYTTLDRVAEWFLLDRHGLLGIFHWLYSNSQMRMASRYFMNKSYSKSYAYVMGILHYCSFCCKKLSSMKLKRQSFHMWTVSLRVIRFTIFHLFTDVSLGVWIP